MVPAQTQVARSRKRALSFRPRGCCTPVTGGMRVRTRFPLLFYVVVGACLPLGTIAAAPRSPAIGHGPRGEGAAYLEAAARSKAESSRTSSRTSTSSHGGGGRAFTEGPVQKSSIRAIDKPFLRKQGERERGAQGIYFDLTGEPESGIPWIARVIVDLAISLCGSSTNPWCEMGGLEIVPGRPDPWYAFEMIDNDRQELFMHFNFLADDLPPRKSNIICLIGAGKTLGAAQHQIPGFDVGRNCSLNSKPRSNKFANHGPCATEDGESVVARGREELLSCLPETSLSSGCLRRMPARDPSERRMAVLFRDPREMVISEHRVRKEVFRQARIPNLELFIQKRFETIVGWIHQRWVWHTTVLRDTSHVMFYEDLEADPLNLLPLAEFKGLKCSTDQTTAVWRAHRHTLPPAGAAAHDLSTATVAWMNETMQSLLPEPTLARWGLSLASR